MPVHARSHAHLAHAQVRHTSPLSIAVTSKTYTRVPSVDGVANGPTVRLSCRNRVSPATPCMRPTVPVDSPVGRR